MALQNIILWITMVTIVTSVHSMHIQRVANKQVSQNAITPKIMKRSIFNSPSFPENDLSTEDRIGQQPLENNDDLYIPAIPKACENLTYCEEVLNYPEAAVSKLIAKLGDSITLQVDKLVQPDFVQRINIDGFIDLCNSTETVIYPQMGLGEDNKFHNLVNGKSKEEKKQGFRVQNCSRMDCDCDPIILGFQDGYKGLCHQYEIYRTATAFKNVPNSDDLESYQVQIRLPGYCACIAVPTD